MHPRISHVRRAFRDKDVHLGLGPPKGAREQRQTKAFQTVEDIHHVPPAEFLVVRVLWPHVCWPHEIFCSDVYETGLAHPLLVVFTDVAAHGSAKLPGCRAEKLTPEVDVGVQMSVIKGFDWEAIVLYLQPATRLEVPAMLSVRSRC